MIIDEKQHSKVSLRALSELTEWYFEISFTLSGAKIKIFIITG